MPKQTSVSRSRRLIDFIGSRTFFGVVLGIFTFQSLWIALSARYPQAFDEQFHLGIIKLYSTHLSPFLGAQTPNVNQFGAIAADPSYLYHYLFSFPYRLLHALGASDTVTIIVFRVLNILLLGSGIIIFRKLFGLTRTSPALSNFVLLCFVLTPVVSLLASQINYDNLLVPLAGLAIYLTARFSQNLRKNSTWSWTAVGAIAIVCMLASLVKYAFLPIAFGIFVWLLVELRWYRKQARSRLLPSTLSARQVLKLVAFSLLIVLSAGLFLQRYGLNVLRYHTPMPECDQVLSIAECQSYAPWARNYSFATYDIHLTTAQVITYPFVWIYHVMGELVFTIASAFNTTGTVDYYVGTQLILVEIVSWLVFAVGIVAVIMYGRRLFTDRILQASVLLSLFYILILWAQNYMDYLHLGLPVAIHGRYLLPILPILYLLVARAIQLALQAKTLRRFPATNLKVGAALVVTIILLIEGGGFVTYIVRSNPSWFWPQSSAVRTVNFRAKEILTPIIIDYRR